MANTSKLPAVMILIAVATTGIASFLAMSTAGSDSSSAAAAGSRAAAPPPSVQVVEAPRPVPVPAPVLDSAVPAAQPPAFNRNRMARDVKREQIWSALGREHQLEPTAPGSAAPKPETAKRLPALDREYIRSAIAEQLLPVAIECYESALADDPKLAGKLVAEFTIIGVQDVGGVVEEASIKAEDSTLDSEFVRECMRESLLAVTFEPPPDGGQVRVTYPFEFAPEG